MGNKELLLKKNILIIFETRYHSFKWQLFKIMNFFNNIGIKYNYYICENYFNCISLYSKFRL